VLLSASPTGPQFTVSTDTTQNQIDPEVAMAASGDFVVVWDAISGSDRDIFFQLFDPRGNPKFGTQQFARSTSHNETNADVAMDASGNFVVVWTRSDVDGGGLNDVYFQRFDSTGDRLGSATKVFEAEDNSDQQNAKVAVADGGDFIVVWQNRIGTRSSDVRYRMFDSAGVAKTDTDQIVADDSTLEEFEPDVALAPNTSDFVVVWTEEIVGGGERDVFFRLFNDDGTEKKARTQANTTDLGRNQESPSVAMNADNNFAIAWSQTNSARDIDVFLQQFEPKGALRGPEVVVDGGAGFQRFPSVTMSDDVILVAYETLPIRDRDVFYKQFSADANTTARGAARTVQRPADTILRDMATPSAAMNPSGEFVIAYQFDPPFGADLILARNFRHDAPTPGLYDPTNSTFFLRNSNSTGPADLVFSYGAGGAGLQPLAGDWDHDGLTTIGLYEPTSSTFLLSNTNESEDADLTFVYGAGGLGWIPVVGDWNGDGLDTVGLYAPDSSTFFLSNANQTRNADLTFVYGPAGLGWLPIAGDWDGDGIDTIGLYDPASSTFFLNNTNATKNADLTFAYGAGGLGWQPLAGDWNRNGADTVGLYAPDTSTYFLNNSNASNNADLTFVYGPGGLGWIPIVGDWNGPGELPLRAAEGEVTPAADVEPLTEPDLQPIVAEALARWEQAGMQTDLASVEFVVTDLPGSLLGLTDSGTIYVDRDAAGHGWFIDATPGDDDEFARIDPGAELAAVDPLAAIRMDLLTVVSHELGHIAGLDDFSPEGSGLMDGTLSRGIRRLPGAADVDLYFSLSSTG